MSVFNPANVKIGAGVLYAAPLGTTEPVSVTGAWPAGWLPLGFTDQGSTFTFGPTVAPVEVEELFWPIEQAVTAYTGKLAFVLSEVTRQNLALGLNAGIGTATSTITGGSADTAAQGTNTDGSLWQEAPSPGAEVRVMLGWDAINESGGTVQSQAPDPYGRIIIRQALQVGMLTTVHRKGNNKTMYAMEFGLEFPKYTPNPNPAGANFGPVHFINPANLAA